MLCVVVHKTRSIALSVFIALGVSLCLPDIARAQTSPSDFDRTCQYFSNVAFKDRRAGLSYQSEPTFRMQLAQDCVDAMIFAASDDPATRARALSYLTRMEAYRRTLIDMLLTRAQGRTDDGSTRRYMRHVVIPISRPGGYLIARDMGLVDTHRDWTNWRRQAALPLFRLDGASWN